MSRPPPSRSLGAAFACLLTLGAAQAQIIETQPPPSLLSYATDVPTLHSRALAASSFQGSRRVPPLLCNDSFAFWSCREEFDSGDLFEPQNRALDERHDSGTAGAERRVGVFERTDHGHAEAWSRAASQFGSNRAEAVAMGGSVWDETRVQSAWDPGQTTISGMSTSFAAASSVWTDVFVADADGSITLQFSLTQHPRGLYGAGSRPGPFETLPGDGFGSLTVQVFNLDEFGDYFIPDRLDPISGPQLVAGDEVGRLAEDGAGSTLMSLSFEVHAGVRYALASQLALEAGNDAWVDMFGTARLDRIVVDAGQALAFGSGTAYNVSVVPEPATWALWCLGAGGLAARALVRARRGRA